MKLFNDAQVEWIKKGYRHLSLNELLHAFNFEFHADIKLSQMRAFVKNHKIKSGRTGHFPKGQLPWNTGTVGVIKANSGTFKKGKQPVNHKPVGSERLNVDGYIEVKTEEPSIWKLKHRVIWEESNGPIPIGHKIVFHDGDKLNCCIENLRILSNAELGLCNRAYKIGKQPTEIRDSIMLISKIEMKSKDLAKGVNNESR